MITTTEIYVNELVFQSHDVVYLFGFILKDGAFEQTQYVIDRKDLLTLLGFNGRQGIELMWEIEQLFVLPHQVPASINLLDLFGITQVFEATRIVIDVPFSQTQGEKPDLVRDYSILFIESITPKYLSYGKA